MIRANLDSSFFVSAVELRERTLDYYSFTGLG
jgi:hypothetical protein